MYVQPQAPKSAVVGIYQNRLKVKIKALPVEGQANQEICRWLGKLLKVPKSQIEVIRGTTHRNKGIYIVGIALKDVESIIMSILEEKKQPT